MPLIASKFITSSKSVLLYAKNNNTDLLDVINFEAIKGMGLKGIIQGAEYYAGNVKLMKELKLNFDESAIEKETLEGKTPVILSSKNKILGVIMVADAIKPEANEALKMLHKLGIKTVMLTGDNKNTAKFIAREAGIDEVEAEVMPQDKLKKIKELQALGKIVEHF